MENKIEAMLVFEALGKPKEHLTGFLNELVKKIGEEKGVKIISNNLSEPILAKDQKEIYTSFAELELSLDKIQTLVMIIFKYMPAHIDISYPEKVSMNNHEWNEVVNEIVRRLHAYDEVARVMQMERMVLENKLKEMLKKLKDTNK
ncbi:hypothetical protein HYT23_00125 [Candidatus Pacearchaeota archaeon]|nr:hypothetical protein [Candidatus Pacearchaeota archaeon]